MVTQPMRELHLQLYQVESVQMLISFVLQGDNTLSLIYTSNF